MRRILAALYAALAYLAFLLPIAYLVGFLADTGVPKTVDRGAGPLGPSLQVDLLLLLAFGLQHSVMARPGFKRRLQRWVPPGLERSTYVLASGTVLGILFWLWRPVPLVLWEVTGTPLEGLAWAGFVGGLGLAVWATFALSHLHLFGVPQAAAWGRRREPPGMVLRESLLYRIVRHPMTAGLLLLFWSTPRMTLGHAVFALGMTAYSLLATVLEERDLMRLFPERYGAYRMRVPALVPPLRPGRVLPRGGGLAVELTLVGAAALLPLASLSRISLRPPDLPETDPPLERQTLVVSGHVRSFVLFDPEGGNRGAAREDASGPDDSGDRTARGLPRPRRPLVLALHGSGGNAGRFRGFLGGELERLAAERGWLVAYPEAVRGVWNDCRRRAGAAPRAAGIDDVDFLRRLADRLARERHADPRRVFLLGYSGGGHMAFRVGLEAPSVVRAVAVFGASLPTEDELACDPGWAGVPVLMVNGTRDPVSPFTGGDVIAPTGRALGAVRASRESARWFEERAGGRAVVRLVSIEGGGHAVPGPASRFPRAVGRTVRSYAGVKEALAFFAAQTGGSRASAASTARDRGSS